MKFLRKIVWLIPTGVIGFQVMKITAQDDWDNIIYDTKAYFNQQFNRNKSDSLQKKKKVVILGSGWGALSFLQQLDKNKIDVTIVSPRPYFFYTPLLTQASTGTVSQLTIKEPIRWYCNRTHHETAEYLQAECKGLDINNKQIICADVSGNVTNVNYDYLVVAVGCEPATYGIEGVKENVIFMKELEDSFLVQSRMLKSLEIANAMLMANGDPQEIDRILHWVIVGGGPTGVELSAEITDFIQQDIKKYYPLLADRVRVTVVEALDRLLTMFDPTLSSYAHDCLKEQGVNVALQTQVTKFTPTTVSVKGKTVNGELPTWIQSVPSANPVKNQDGTQFMTDLPYGLAVWAGGIAVRPITKSIAATLGPDKQNSRFGIEVDKKLRVKGASDNSIWAIGDCAVTGNAPTAQSANQQGIYLGRLFRDTNLDSQAIEEYKEYKFQHKGSLAYVGGSKGIAELKNIWSFYPMTNESQFKVEGVSAFAIWRSLYFSKLMSSKNRYQVMFEWFRTSVFGRDIASTTFLKDFQQQETPKK